ncbi:MAG: protein mraZ [Bacteroidales bacterium]|nr:protein mraZ [Bacteroidales bacterium]
MFVGDYNSKLDSKCRVIFPSQLKRQVSEEEQAAAFVLKRDIYEKCLVLYTKSEWNRQVDMIRKALNPFNPTHAEFLREFYRGAAEVYLDNNARFLIPRFLLDYMGAEKDLAFVGSGDKIEIWDSEAYKKREMNRDTLRTLAKELLGGNFSFSGGLANE